MTVKTRHTRSALAQLHALDARRFKGDYGACDALIDLQGAVNRAGLTERQAKALRLVYVDDLSQAVAGERMGVTQQAISVSLSAGIQKIAEADSHGRA